MMPCSSTKIYIATLYVYLAFAIITAFVKPPFGANCLYSDFRNWHRLSLAVVDSF